FSVPCAVYFLASLWRRDRIGLALTGTAVAFFVVLSALGDLLVPSAVDKTAANLWGNLVEENGPKLVVEARDQEPTTIYMAGLRIVPGTAEPHYDPLVRRSREFTARQYFVEHADEILSLFVHRLGEVLASGCWGLRFLTGEAVLGLFVFQVLVSVVRRDA